MFGTGAEAKPVRTDSKGIISFRKYFEQINCPIIEYLIIILKSYENEKKE